MIEEKRTGQGEKWGGAPARIWAGTFTNNISFPKFWLDPLWDCVSWSEQDPNSSCTNWKGGEGKREVFLGGKRGMITETVGADGGELETNPSITITLLSAVARAKKNSGFFVFLRLPDSLPQARYPW